MTNYSDQSGPAVYGRVNLIQALVNSINSVFCNIGKEMGPKPIVDYMKRYGFYSVPPLETPVNERRAERPLRQRQAVRARDTRARSTRAGSPSARSGCR